MALPIILDTDIGNDPDDLLALAMILDRDDLFDLQAVITTGKNPTLRAQYVQYLCDISSQKIPIGLGVASDNSKEPTRIHTDFFKKLGADLSSSCSFPDARDILRKVLSPEVTILTIGPLSTLADFIVTSPSCAHQIHNVVSMGGFISRSNKNKFVPEYNFGSDLTATKIVLAMNFNHVCVTKNVCGGIIMSAEECISTNFSRSPARRFAFAFMRDWFQGRTQKKLHDPFTAVAALNTENLIMERVEFSFNHRACKGSIIDDGQRRASIGGTPKSLNWFFKVFYGEASTNERG